MKSSADYIQLAQKYSAHNYAPLDVVISEAEGVWVKDVEGKRYLDLLSAYSAVNLGHCNRRIEEAAIKQLKKLTLTSRAFYNEQFALMCKELTELCKMEAVILMNSGAEAVETAIKIARRWAYQRKGLATDSAEIFAFSGNFHGRTTTIVSFSDAPSAREDFGPFTPGFKIAPYGNFKTLEKMLTPQSAAILVEPIQGEGGVIIPPDSFLKDIRQICDERNIMMIADEIQTAFYRTGKLFACDHANVQPDMIIVAKSLGGGVVPISAVLTSRETMDVLTPGSHGSTFGGNPFACSVAREVLAILREGDWAKQVSELGAHFMAGLNMIQKGNPKIKEVRGRGLLFGVDIDPAYGKAKKYCSALKDLGVLAKDTRDQTIRFAPPIIVTKDELDFGLDKIAKVLG